MRAAQQTANTTPPNDPLAEALAALEKMRALMEQMFADLLAQLEDLKDQIDDLVNPDPDPDKTGRLVISTDGNAHDTDDILSAPMSLALIAATGRQDELELMVYSDHVWSTKPAQEALMQESVLGAADRFDFDETKFVSGVDTPNWAAKKIAEQVDASSAQNPLTILMAGPAHTIARGIEMSDPDKREHVTVVSHSQANQTHSEKHGSPYTWEMIQESGVETVKIPDQNQKLNTGEGAWDWMQETPDLAWVYDRNQKDNFDTSDAGMTYYYLTGDQAGTPAKFEDYLT